MGKSKESKAVNRDLSSQTDYLRGKQSSYDPTIQGQLDRSNSSFGSAANAYDTALGSLGDFGGAASSLMSGGPPVDVSALKGDAATYRNFAQGNTESGKFYRDLMNTGGYSPEQLADMSAEGNSVVPAFFENLKNQYGSAQAATGGYSPGYGASLAKLSREGAREAQDAARRTSLGIGESVRSGKERGAGGLEREFLGGMAGASQNEANALQGLLQGRGQDLSAKAAGAGMLGDAGRLALGVGQGYTSLGQASPNAALQYEDLARGYSGEVGQNLGQRQSYNPNQGWFDKYGMPILGMGAGLAAPWIGGNRKPKGSSSGSYGSGQTYNGGWS